MARRRLDVTLNQMLDSARTGITLSQGRGRGDLDTDRLFGLAIARVLVMVGGAAARVPPGAQDRHPDIPWSRFATLRDELIHEYDVVDYNAVWDVLVNELPPLAEALEQAIAQERG